MAVFQSPVFIDDKAAIPIAVFVNILLFPLPIVNPLIKASPVKVALPSLVINHLLLALELFQNPKVPFGS